VCVEQAGKAGPFGDCQGKGSAETNTAQRVTGVDDAGRIPQRWRPTTQCRSVTNRRNLGQSFKARLRYSRRGGFRVNMTVKTGDGNAPTR
jgi:hypothetical protein